MSAATWPPEAPAPPVRAQPRAPLAADARGVLLVLRELVARHPQLRGHRLKVLLFLLPDLLDGGYQPVKQVALGRALRMSQSVVSRSLLRLVTLGLLEQGPKDGALKTYGAGASLLYRFDYAKRMSTLAHSPPCPSSF